MSSNYATPTTSSSTPGTTESVSSGRYFNSNRPNNSTTTTSHQLGFAPPLPPSAPIDPQPSTSATNIQRPSLTHASSSTSGGATSGGSYSNGMVFLEEHNISQTTSGGVGGGGGGATFLSDEETNASENGSTAVPSLSGPPPLVPLSATPINSKGKGKATEGGDSSITPDAATSTTTGKKKAAPKTKKQTIGPDGKPVTRERKKKAGRACAACQKAHLTCDDGRPCKRCIKKGCPDDCVDGARKKAKYLQEIPDELLERGRQAQGEGSPFTNGSQLHASPSATTLKPSQSPVPPSQSLPSTSSAPPPPPTSSQPIFDFSSTLNDTSAAGPSTTSNPTISSSTPAFYDTSSFLNFGSTPSGGLIDHTQFGSEAANLEYAILSSMLNGNGFALDAHTPNLSGGIGASLGGGNQNSFFQGGGGGAQNGRTGGSGEEMLLGGGSRNQKNAVGEEGQQNGGGFGEFNQEKQGGDTEMFSAEAGDGTTSAQTEQATERATQQNVGSGVPGLMTAEEALRSVTKPYPYAQSYHFLVKHLKTRFEKNDILRIVRALATFRPSLIALQMPLTEEDETFVERTFQRTLVELHKLISFSGTPTVVWRRTGEICLVGTEFCLLTGWKREELVGTGNVNGMTTNGGGRAGGGKYIFELFDTASVVEYYESFAKHAFESTSTSVTLQCVVLGPDGRPVPCAFCFSVRRDLFSCPYLIIGSFLPILV
ncbi:hypothetical protein JCM5350_007535 [Sporobolomyces pararoseus]